ncbi:MAG: hypothetical protein C0179_08090 [Fervidicoccus sp.]|nr:MAG: hypothetical protein C0179_08090 [Fervidicoccus sp.]
MASCSPKLNEQKFRNTIVRAGLNSYMNYHANIREHVSYPMGMIPKKLRVWQQDILRTAVASLSHTKPIE